MDKSNDIIFFSCKLSVYRNIKYFISVFQVVCFLETQELWEKFFSLGTEMIITKSGR